MRYQLTAFDLSKILDELIVLKGSKVDKVYHQKKDIYIVFHVPNIGKKILKIMAGGMIYLAEKKPEIEKPSSFCMFLRKKLNNARLRNIEQISFERVIKLSFEKEEEYTLYLELFGQGNVVLTKEDKILAALKQKKWKDRHILTGKKYNIPKKEFNLLELDLKLFKKFLNETEQPTIVKALAADLGLGGFYSEEILKEEKNLDPKELDEKQIKKILLEIKKLSKRKIKPIVIYKENRIVDVLPFLIEKYKENKTKEFKTFSEAMDFISSSIKVESKEEKVYKEKLEKIKVIINSQEETIKKLEKMGKEGSLIGEKIYSDYAKIKDLLEKISTYIKENGFKEAKKKKKGIIKEINEKEKSIVIELE